MKNNDFEDATRQSALEIIQRGDVHPNRLVGSWAGAFGPTQFMPTAFKKFAVDFDGDGKRNTVDDIPDIIASGKTQPHINVYGGEDRFWLGPEGGQFSIFFAKDAKFDLPEDAAINHDHYLYGSPKKYVKAKSRWVLSEEAGR